MIRLVILAVAAAACVSTSRVGPYVKHVERNGDWLVIHKCVIELAGDELAERDCTYEQVPLRQVPMGPAPPVNGPPGGPIAPPQGAPMPPAAPPPVR